MNKSRDTYGSWMIEEKNPLKQGLKQESGQPCIIVLAIEEKNPLKQGLKPRKGELIPSSCSY